MFAVGGKLGHPLYLPEIPLREKSRSSPFQHIHGKILGLYEGLHFQISKEIAKPLRIFTQKFSDQFLQEWDSNDYE